MFVPSLSKIIHSLESKAMRSKYFPMFLFDLYFKTIKNSKRHNNYTYNIFDKLIKECVLLNLNIKEDEVFSFKDVDEIKAVEKAESEYQKYRIIQDQE